MFAVLLCSVLAVEGEGLQQMAAVSKEVRGLATGDIT